MIVEYQTKVIIILNQLRWYDGEIQGDVRFLEKILQCLNNRLEIIATTIEEKKDLETMSIV